MKYKVGVVDDHTMFRKGLIEIINLMQNFEVVMEASSGEEVIETLVNSKPHVLILDLKMPRVDGFEVLREVVTKHPEMKIIALSMFDNEKFILHAFHLGIHGYLLKNADPAELEKALEHVINKGYYFTDKISEILARGLKKRVDKPDFSEISLQEKDREILQLICKGFTNEEIGRKIFVSKRTVEGHRKNLIVIAGVRNTAELVAWAFRNNLVD
jgi:DNA-binding NarL/FixJ family response regulator